MTRLKGALRSLGARLAEVARRHRRAVLGVVVVAGLVLGPGLTLWLRYELGEARAAVTDERAAVQGQERRFAAARAAVAATARQLAGVTVIRDQAHADLARIERDLGTVEAHLAATADTIAIRGPQAALLGRCLDGVTAALNQSAVADRAAGGTLTLIADTCAQARAAITGTPP